MRQNAQSFPLFVAKMILHYDAPNRRRWRARHFAANSWRYVAALFASPIFYNISAVLCHQAIFSRRNKSLSARQRRLASYQALEAPSEMPIMRTPLMLAGRRHIGNALRRRNADGISNKAQQIDRRWLLKNFPVNASCEI